jgi:hypothetical protein
MQAGDKVMLALTPMPKESLRTLGNLLARISDAALNLPEPPAHVLIKAKRDSISGRIHLQFSKGLSLTACCWKVTVTIAILPHGARMAWKGHTWEVLDQLSQTDALTFDELHEKTSRRGVTREAHAADVQELARRGWAEEGSGVIQITAEGKQVRAEVEAETERLFFAPWSSLNESELDDLASLANPLRDGLRS